MPGSDKRQYPGGTGTPNARPILGTFVEFGVSKFQRTRVTAAQVNAGFILLPALPTVRWRLVDLILIAIGGAATTVTDVRLLGTRAAASVALGIAAVAGLTQSAMLRLGAATVVVLADGASLTQLDANTAVTAGKTGGSLAGATSIDYLLTFVADPQ